MLTALAPETNAITVVYASPTLLSSLRTFSSREERESYTANETNEATATPGPGSDRTIQDLNQKETTIQELDTFRENGTPTNTLQEVYYSEDYLKPVDNVSLQPAFQNRGSSRFCRTKMQTLPHNSRPVLKPRDKILSKHSTFTSTTFSSQLPDQLKHDDALYDRQGVQHCAGVKRVNQSSGRIGHSRTLPEKHSYQNDRRIANPCKTKTNQSSSLPPIVRGESPYARVQCNTNWEVPRDHLSLFERVGGGTFGQVWKGAALDVGGTQGWSVVAVKMLKG